MCDFVFMNNVYQSSLINEKFILKIQTDRFMFFSNKHITKCINYIYNHNCTS